VALDQFALNPAVTGVFVADHRKGYCLGACQEIRQLIDGRDVFEFHDGFHPSIMTGTRSRFRMTGLCAYNGSRHDRNQY
jgi:hypothetical protein